MNSSQRVLKERCRELGLMVNGDKQALLARIVNKENGLTTDRQVKGTQREMLCTFKDTEPRLPMNNMPCQHRQAEITAEIKGDFERGSELRQWYQNHSGECPSSDDKTEASLAKSRDRRTRALFARSSLFRRTRALNNRPCFTELAAKEMARLSSILVHALVPSTQGDFERCSELRQWYKNHSGECPRRTSDDPTERTLAQWLDKARPRRARAISKYPSGRQLNAKETAQLNSILASASKSRTTSKDLNPVPDGNQRPKPPISQRWLQKSTKHDIKRCNELRRWFVKHAGQRPRRRSDDETEASLALWLDRSLIRRTRAVSNRPSARQLTPQQTNRLNSILAQAMAPSTKKC